MFVFKIIKADAHNVNYNIPFNFILFLYLIVNCGNILLIVARRTVKKKNVYPNGLFIIDLII